MNKKIALFLILLLFLIGCNEPQNAKNEEGLNKYPSLFLEDKEFNAIVVVEDFTSDDELAIAQNFVGDLDKKYKLKPDTLIQYRHIDGLYDKNAIFIGTCNMEPHNRFVNLFMDCLSMENQIGMIRLIEKEDISIVSVVGKDIEDTKNAIEVLINSEDYNLSGTEIQVRRAEDSFYLRTTGRM